MQKFWMVMGKNAPVKRHTSFRSAQEEAKRLAEAYPQVSFIVLEAMGEMMVRLPTATWCCAGDPAFDGRDDDE